MSWSIGDTEEERRQRDAIAMLLNRVVLGLLDDARRTGGFGDDEAALRSRAGERAERFIGRPSKPASVELKLLSGDRITLTVGDGQGNHASAEVREDGYVLGGSTGRSNGGKVITARPEDMEPWEREELERRELAREAAKGKPPFRDREYLRTVVAPSQPGATLRILAVQLYSDGLIVEFTYDNEMPSREELERGAPDRRPPMTIEDDLGTGYYEGERASYGGSPVSHAYFTFAPAVPADAGVLRITTDSGTVEVGL